MPVRGRGRGAQRSDGFVEHNSAMVEDFLKLGYGFVALMPKLTSLTNFC